MSGLRIQCICVDAGDPSAVADFWEAALGWRRTYERLHEVVLEPPEGSKEDGVVPDLLFLRVPGDGWRRRRGVTRNCRAIDSRGATPAADPPLAWDPFPVPVIRERIAAWADGSRSLAGHCR